MSFVIDFLSGRKMIAAIHKHIQREEFDYQTLLDVLRDYGRPRDKISDLLRKGVIIRVKKGLYVLGDDFRSRPYSRELLANLIYGPSYVSLDSALQYHGLIPEHVEAVTSVATGRTRAFDTPVGRFTYRQIPLAAFHVGMCRVEETPDKAFLIAAAEKALADKVFDERNIGVASIGRMMDFLIVDLRLVEDRLMRLDAGLLHEIAGRYRSHKLRILAEAIERGRTDRKRGQG
jgi:predicted transcriptional regulator of viral defense system